MRAQDKELEQGRFFAVIAYLGLLCLVPLIFKKSNKFALFHGKQGLILFIWEVGALVVSIIPLFGKLILGLSWLACFLFAVIGMLQAWMGEYWRLPSALGKWAEELEV
jgi:fumarate reductase subunit D